MEKNPQSYPQNPQSLISIVSEELGIDATFAVTNRREKELVRGRILLAHLLRLKTDWSLKTIGQFLGKRHYTSVIHLLNQAKLLLASDENFKYHIGAVLEKLNGNPVVDKAKKNRKRLEAEFAQICFASDLEIENKGWPDFAVFNGCQLIAVVEIKRSKDDRLTDFQNRMFLAFYFLNIPAFRFCPDLGFQRFTPNGFETEMPFFLEPKSKEAKNA